MEQYLRFPTVFKVIIRAIYKTFRSILFSVTLFVVGLYVLLYTLLSIPAFTNAIKDVALNELSAFLGGNVLIEQLDVYPFNEVKITGLEVFDPQGRKCIDIQTVAAGISIWKLLSERRIILTYGEIIGLNAYIVQPEKDAPLNIDFIIKAFSSSDNTKEKTPFELALKNVVLRKSSAVFERPWLKGKTIGTIDLSHLSFTDLAADISFPKISDKGVEVDLRRLSLEIPDATVIEKIGLKGEFNQETISVENFIFELPSSQIFIPSFSLNAGKEGNFLKTLSSGNHSIDIDDSFITPSDLAFLFPFLENFTQPISINIRAIGNLNEVSLETFELGNPDLFTMSFVGGCEEIRDIADMKGNVADFNFHATSNLLKTLANIHQLPSTVRQLVSRLDYLKITGDLAGAMSNKSVKGNIEIETDDFLVTFEGGMNQVARKKFQGEGELNIENLSVQDLIPSVPIGALNANVVAQVTVDHGSPEGMVSLSIENFDYKGKKYEGLSLNLNKIGENVEGDILMQNDIADFTGNFGGSLTEEEKNARLDIDLRSLNLSSLIDMKAYEGYLISGNISMDGSIEKDNLINGELFLSEMAFTAPDNSRSLHLKNLDLTADSADGRQSLALNSDWVEARVEGHTDIKKLPSQIVQLVENVFPALIPIDNPENDYLTSNLEFDAVIKKNNAIPEFFNLPIRLLVPVTISGTIQSSSNSASLSLDCPYLQQGKDKLIYDTKVVADIDGSEGTLNTLIQTTLPIKKGDLALNVNLFGFRNKLSTDFHWLNTENQEFRGHIILDTEFSRNEFTSQPEISLNIKPSVLHMGTADWNIGNSFITYADKIIDVNGFKLWHDNQLVEIKGKASPEYSDVLNLTLRDIDVDYIFDMLQINYVTFGGTATGVITGQALLSGNPVAETESLEINEFTYNGAFLGKCVASSRWNNEEKEIEINAVISQEGQKTVDAMGGIWLGRDSLSFDIEADKVPVDFVQPFMAVFSSHVGGMASGNVKLFGTFRDIDMTGRIFADSVAVKLDYTNTVYHGSDSVFLNPGQIEIPHFRLYDKYGNSGMLTGELTHRYFHDPSFNFRLNDAYNLLCYDTTSELNPDWYGTLFGTGSALIKGIPGLVEISADMTVAGNSNFTFVLNDTQYARDYQFLTFSDKKKEAAIQDQPVTPRDIKEFLKNSMKKDDEGSLSRFGIDIRATVTPEVLFTLVMDPAAGDKITARGRGAMQMKYESDNDEMMLYGKYEIDEGNYNFSLQDIILRDFKIKEGSSISFNGDPLNADLDISATYRVNTNLSDLDKSFSTDRDLNRTNVPVDAVLSVNGFMTHPDITFDIQLPTLTQDVERKVKSIISTDDMMNRQIIYLLALNRFYTPEYMGGTGNGGELAAVASSTISSQLSNILGQLTDKFSVSPSFRSDKGDFSDIEVDVALSSRLLNNRLLINGNFGYRDRSNSSTTFVGDFDVEYLLTKNGNLRLKAYNHFNDQNYYLREALTTQGLGLVFRRDFDDWISFLRKKKKEAIESAEDLATPLLNNKEEKDGTEN
ncbi:MAG: translocation/assembly module TamB [Muribaculaceae bacterium]|nr:translocation/assembly module TamB [Muribaculaceae bacterium]